MKTTLSPLALAAALLLFAGCSTTNVDTVGPADQRISTDITLGRGLRTGPVLQAASGDLLKVQVTVENLKNSDQNLHYRFEWVSADGLDIATPANAWRVVQLKGRETVNLSAVAPTPAATDFRLKLQEAK